MKGLIYYICTDPDRSKLERISSIRRNMQGMDIFIASCIYPNFFWNDADTYMTDLNATLARVGVELIPGAWTNDSADRVQGYLYVNNNGTYQPISVWNDPLIAHRMSDPATWDDAVECVSRLKNKTGCRYVYCDMEWIWANRARQSFQSMKTVFRLADDIARYTDRIMAMGVTPIFYDIYMRELRNTTVSDFVRIAQPLVWRLSETGAWFGDPQTYFNPTRTTSSVTPFSELKLLYPRSCIDRVLWMGIHLGNAPYGYTAQEWDAFVTANNVPSWGLFGNNLEEMVLPKTP